MKKISILILLFTFVTGLIFQAQASGVKKAVIEFKDPQNAAERSIKQSLQKADIPSMVTELINDTFILNRNLNILFGGDDGPLYDSDDNTILIPYGFIQETKERFELDNYSERGLSIEDATLDSLMHTLFHEFGHAVIFMYDLPIVGKEEDAVDGLSTILLIESFEDGQEIAITAADLFDLEAPETIQLQDPDFWDEHSLDTQRYFSTLCYVYGSDAIAYAFLIELTGFSEERAELCIMEYEDVSRNWEALLEPYMKSTNHE